MVNKDSQFDVVASYSAGSDTVSEIFRPEKSTKHFKTEKNNRHFLTVSILDNKTQTIS